MSAELARGRKLVGRRPCFVRPHAQWTASDTGTPSSEVFALLSVEDQPVLSRDVAERVELPTSASVEFCGGIGVQDIVNSRGELQLGDERLDVFFEDELDEARLIVLSKSLAVLCESVDAGNCVNSEFLCRFRCTLNGCGQLRGVVTDLGEDVERNRILELLLLTSWLDRFLREAFVGLGAWNASEVESPSRLLLCDILRSEFLHRALGHRTLAILRALLGSPRLVNLRNLAWHGFLMSVSGGWPALLFCLFRSLHRDCYDRKLWRDPSATLRDLRVLSWDVVDELRVEELDVLEEKENCALGSALDSMAMEGLRKDFQSSQFTVPEIVEPLVQAFVLRSSSRYLESCVLVVVVLERCLRRLVVRANQLDVSLLTAHTDEFYVSFDEIFAPELQCVGGCVPNRLGHVVGPAILECLLDLFVHEDGPRVRDGLSHGEITSVKPCICNSLLGVLLGIVSACANSKDRESMSSDGCARLFDSYHSQRSPRATAFRALVVAARGWQSLLDFVPDSSAIEADSVGVFVKLRDQLFASGFPPLFEIGREIPASFVSALVIEFAKSIPALSCGKMMIRMCGTARRTCEVARSVCGKVLERIDALKVLHEARAASTRQRLQFVRLLGDPAGQSSVSRPYVFSYVECISLALQSTAALLQVPGEPSQNACSVADRWCALLQRLEISLSRNTGTVIDSVRREVNQTATLSIDALASRS